MCNYIMYAYNIVNIIFTYTIIGFPYNHNENQIVIAVFDYHAYYNNVYCIGIKISCCQYLIHLYYDIFE